MIGGRRWWLFSTTVDWEGTVVRFGSWRRQAILVVGPVSLLIGLGGTGLPTAAAQGVPVLAASPPVPILDWKPCTNPFAVGFECATAQVPLDYRHPYGVTISLAVIKHRATNAAKRIG